MLPPALAEGDLGRHYVDSLVERTETLAEVIEHLASRDNLPAVFHCTAGKDRTGMVAALVLSLVGVPDDVIVHDYTLTDDRMALVMERIRASGDFPEPVTPLLERVGRAEAASMETFLAAVRDTPRRRARVGRATRASPTTTLGVVARRCSSPTPTDERTRRCCGGPQRVSSRGLHVLGGLVS